MEAFEKSFFKKSMFLHAGNNKNIYQKEIIGIFDMDKVTVSKRGREYLQYAEKEGITVALFDELPKSFIVTDEAVYFSQISSSALIGRIEDDNNFLSKENLLNKQS